MAYSQKNLIDLIGEGRIPGEHEAPARIETVISHVFLFKEKAYKLYKNDNEFFNTHFNDLSTKDARILMTKTDFAWNKQLSEEIYITLQGVSVRDGVVVFADSLENSEEVLQVLKRLPAGAILFDQLVSGVVLTNGEYAQMGMQFAQREKGFVYEGQFPEESLLENMRGREKDIDEWIQGVGSYIPAAEQKRYADMLCSLVTEVYGFGEEKTSICFDSHSMNAFYADGKLYPFDTYAPKKEWCFGPRFLNMYRLASDIYAFSGEGAFRSFVDSYFATLEISHSGKTLEYALVLYASLIMVPYLYMLGAENTQKMDSAKKYHSFLKTFAGAE